jgi:hypothetical protein
VERSKHMQKAEREEYATRDADGDRRVIRDRRDARSSVAAMPLAVGGLVLVVAAFFDWIDGREQSLTDPNGFQIPDGRIVLGIGAALLLTGILMASNRRVGSWFDADLLGFALSTVALVTVGTLWAYLASDERSPDVGIYLATAGGAIAMVGSLIALLRSRSDRATLDDDGRGDVGRNRRLA